MFINEHVESLLFFYAPESRESQTVNKHLSNKTYFYNAVKMGKINISKYKDYEKIFPGASAPEIRLYHKGFMQKIPE